MNVRMLRRVPGPVVGISLLLLASGVGAACYVHHLQKNVSRVLVGDVASVRAAEELEIGIRQVQAQMSHFLITGDRAYLKAVPALHQETGEWLDRAERLAETSSERRLIARVRKGHGHLFKEFDRVAAGHGDGAREVRQLVDDVINKEILPPAHAYLDENERAAERTSRENESAAGRLALALAVLGSCGALAGLLAGYGITRGINRSIVRLSVPVLDAAGKLSEVVGPVTLTGGADFEELGEAMRRVAEQVGTVVQRLQRSERELLRGEQLAALGQLAAGLAHELRNPLMAMKLLVQAAREPGPAGLGDRDLAVLEEEIARLERTLQGFLDFARPPQMERRPFQVQEVVEQALHLFSSRSEGQRVLLECDLTAAPVVLEADLGQFRQVLVNLLLNSLDAMPGGGTVRVEGGVDGASPGEWLTVRVSDTGQGLPADLGPRIFEPFVSSKETGAGLGLSICKQIVEAHGGSIEAADQPGGGAVFTVRFPLAEGQQPPRPHPGAADGRLRSSDSGLRSQPAEVSHANAARGR